MDVPCYQYRSLDIHSRQIRLLHLLPGVWDDQVSCELHVASLDDTPEYQALSYVWGSPETTKLILLHGCEVPVTTNLHAALRRLRLPTDTRVIWIDALCINQSLLDELSQQVSIMGEIYEGCQEVLMWLGERKGEEPKGDRQTLKEGHDQLRKFLEAGDFTRDPDGVDLDNYEVLLAFSMFYILSSDRHVNELPCFVERRASLWDVSDCFNSGFREFYSIVSLAYWTRIWIVQEIVLPPSATVVYGSMNCPWDVIAQAGMLFENHANSCCLEQCTNFSGEVKDVISAFSFKARTLEMIRMHRSIGTQLDLLWILRQNFHREATDSRDKVYGVLGLVSSPRDIGSIRPDYRRSAREVYEDVTMNLIGSVSSLSVLAGDATRNADFPSWVADWGQQSKKDVWQWDIERTAMYHHYNATKNCELVADRLPGSILKVEGVLVDSIAAVGPLMNSENIGDSTSTTCRDVLALASMPDDDRQIYKCGGTWADAYWRTLCGDMIVEIEGSLKYEMRRTKPEDRQMYELWRTVLQFGYDEALNNHTGIVDLEGYQASVVRATRNRKFFVTQNGYLGLGPDPILPGDDVYVISGSKVPFVLHRVDNSEADSRENDSSSYPVFKLIGDSYVHGIMDGEALESTTATVGSLLLR
ncbi:uncharacterized protein JN550_007665 [Neoarthrinium moseri]|uniref:uncharacterized protein n=1 Tax=Neoarthrinium moseri TaxID=1658444 RepID=UPI001FDBDC22|nr:uncharacterized protein JN550_007665 [Neoarthrinium moseri]KAI1866277.1 hypothetical protein JN550_007665 [Neoarthrinium moseri]